MEEVGDEWIPKRRKLCPMTLILLPKEMRNMLAVFLQLAIETGSERPACISPSDFTLLLNAQAAVIGTDAATVIANDFDYPGFDGLLWEKMT